MLRQLLRKRKKIARGILNTKIRKKGNAYTALDWWDTSFYSKGVSDRQTISQQKSIVTAQYHYASMELQILKHLRNNTIPTSQLSVLDLGSGSGHWVDFYKTLGSRKITGMDLSLSSFEYLSEKYSGNNAVELYHGTALEVLGMLNEDYDLVNAVGVMFHIVDDSEWYDTIQMIGNVLKGGGILVVGGHFGFVDGLNVEIDKSGNIYKRLRSKRHWMEALRAAGFRGVKLYKNRAYLWIEDSLPENNVLIATK